VKLGERERVSGLLRVNKIMRPLTISSPMELPFVDVPNKKGMPLFPEGHAFSMPRDQANYFAFGAAGFFTAITVIVVADILPPSFL
jgi:hypothetical protein